MRATAWCRHLLSQQSDYRCRIVSIAPGVSTRSAPQPNARDAGRQASKAQRRSGRAAAPGWPARPPPSARRCTRGAAAASCCAPRRGCPARGRARAARRRRPAAAGRPAAGPSSPACTQSLRHREQYDCGLWTWHPHGSTCSGLPRGMLRSGTAAAPARLLPSAWLQVQDLCKRQRPGWL